MKRSKINFAKILSKNTCAIQDKVVYLHSENTKQNLNNVIMNKLLFIVGIIALTSINYGNISAQETLAGHIYYNMDENFPMPGTDVFLIDQLNDTVSSATTDEDGAFSMPFPLAGSYSLISETYIPSGGVDFSDSFLIMLHLFGWHDFSTTEALAADVDGNGNINWTDYWTIVVGWFINGYPFPAGEWGQTSVNLLIGAKEDPPAGGGGNNGGGSNPPPEFDDIDIGMISIGDCSGGYSPVLLKEQMSINMIHSELECGANEIIRIPISTNEPINISGLALALNFDSKYARILDVESQFAVNYGIRNGQLRISWIDENAQSKALESNQTILNIVVKTLPGFSKDNNITFKMNPESHFIDESGQRIPYIQLKSASIHSNGQNSFADKLYPNPATSVVYADINPDMEGKIIFNIYSTSGKLMKTIMKEAQGGQIQIDIDDLSKGSYIYTLSNNLTGETIQSTLIIK